MANMLTRIGFIDETSVKTNMAKTTGWAPRGERLVDHAPFGHWHTQTFIAALRHDRLDAPWVIDGPINRDLVDLYIETQLAPTLQPRPQPDRDGFRQAQDPAPKSRRPHISGPLESRRCRLRPLHRGRMPKLLHRRRIQTRLNATSSRPRPASGAFPPKSADPRQCNLPHALQAPVAG